jgi:hypothetical protein
MKKWPWFLPLIFTLYACPFESTVPLEAKPVEPVDSSLVGYWYGIIKDFSDMYGIEALDITKQSDSIYAITRYGKAIKEDMILPDTAYYTGYTSWIGGQRYMNIEGNIVTIKPRKNKPPDITTQKVFYMAAISLRHDTLMVKAVAESFSVKKYFSSSEELKKLVTDMTAQQKEIFDDQYSLSYRKIRKPAR